MSSSCNSYFSKMFIMASITTNRTTALIGISVNATSRSVAAPVGYTAYFSANHVVSLCGTEQCIVHEIMTCVRAFISDLRLEHNGKRVQKRLLQKGTYLNKQSGRFNEMSAS